MSVQFTECHHVRLRYYAEISPHIGHAYKCCGLVIGVGFNVSFKIRFNQSIFAHSVVKCFNQLLRIMSWNNKSYKAEDRR
ncbi:hypothetical protein K1T71_006779 [Dendrolimus kikuchii]|uniref:Uncharacterized protein n=1 Tax=Dendrolimus kikuchii TaxID=765133 RepID=A0ACC1D252_9NEOP|nr:hypothetical protein K1T71_006779 [Dendrolimus kikuchii]